MLSVQYVETLPQIKFNAVEPGFALPSDWVGEGGDVIDDGVEGHL
jgi:hypothetical protein